MNKLMRLFTATAFNTALVVGAAHAELVQMTDDALTANTAGQSVGVDVVLTSTFNPEGGTALANYMDLEWKMIHTVTSNDFAFVFQNLHGSVTIDRIGIDAATVTKSGTVLPATKLTFGAQFGGAISAPAKLIFRGDTALDKSDAALGSGYKSGFGFSGLTTSTGLGAAPSLNPLFGLEISGQLNVQGSFKVFPQ